jgi:RimJ/RimL family protein N-acetyltransferase
MTVALAAPSPLRDGEVTLLPLDGGVPALLVAASHDPEVTRWTQIPEDLTLLDAGLVTGGWTASRASTARLQVCLPELSPAGMVTVWINSAGEAEVGYWLLAPARGRGIARRAVSLLCTWAFETCGLDRLQLTTMPGNTASEKVAAACGFHAQGFVVRDIKGTARPLQLWVRMRDGAAGESDQREVSAT